MSSFSTGNLPHVILWNDFIRFNWESRKGLREAVSGKTGPNHSMDDGRLISLSLGGCTSLPVRTEPQTLATNNIWSWHGIKLIIFCQFMILTFQSLQITDLPVLALLFLLFNAFNASTHINHLYLITSFQIIFKPQFYRKCLNLMTIVQYPRLYLNIIYN